MLTIKRTPLFDAWFAGLPTDGVKTRLLLRLRKAQMGRLDDVISVGQGVFEMCDPACAGLRMYYTQRRGVLVFMLGGCGGAQKSKDIAAAQAVATVLDDSDGEQ